MLAAVISWLLLLLLTVSSTVGAGSGLYMNRRVDIDDGAWHRGFAASTELTNKQTAVVELIFDAR